MGEMNNWSVRGGGVSSTVPGHPSVDDLAIDVDQTAEYAIVVSTFEVYNDRIFDLLTGASQSSKLMNGGRRRALLFKPTEQSPDRKQVAGLKKIICGSLDEALMVLEFGSLCSVSTAADGRRLASPTKPQRAQPSVEGTLGSGETSWEPRSGSFD